MDALSNLSQTLGPYATTEVFTVIGALAAAWIGWRTLSGTLGIASAIVTRCSFVGLAAAVMFLSGFGGLGLGVGEIACRSGAPEVEKVDTIDSRIENEELLAIAEKFNGHSNPEIAKLLVDYVRDRDGIGRELSDSLVMKLVTDTTSENQEAVVAMLELFKAREAKAVPAHLQPAPSFDDVVLGNINYNPLIPDSPKLLSKKEEATKEENPDSIITLPQAWASIFMGIGGIISGISIVCFRSRQLSAA